jgi:hypothetical protein
VDSPLKSLRASDTYASRPHTPIYRDAARGVNYHRSAWPEPIPHLLVPGQPGWSNASLVSAAIFGGRGMPSGVCTVARRSAALRRLGLKSRMPSRARVDLIRFTMRERSPTRHSRSRFGRLASSSLMHVDYRVAFEPDSHQALREFLLTCCSTHR